MVIMDDKSIVDTNLNKQKKVRIMLADDHPLMRYAMRKIISENAKDLEVVAEATNGEEAVKLAATVIPDVILMDITMPKLGGLEATRIIKKQNPDTLILVLTVHEDIEHILGIFEAGADGYLTKSVLGEEVINSIRSMFAGERILSPEIFKQLLKRSLRHPVRSVPLQTPDILTPRELEILILMARGSSNKDIAKQLNLSHLTVKAYLVQVFSKLGVNSRTEAVICGLRAGMFGLEDLD